MVGQQLELVEIVTNFPENKNQQQKATTKQTNNANTHTSQAPGQAEKPGKFAN